MDEVVVRDQERIRDLARKMVDVARSQVGDDVTSVVTVLAAASLAFTSLFVGGIKPGADEAILSGFFDEMRANVRASRVAIGDQERKRG